MTLPRKANHDSHCSYLPRTGAPARRRTPVEWQSYDNLVAVGNREHLREGRPVLGQAARRRSEAALAVQSSVLRGGASSCANQNRDACARRVRTSEQLFRENSGGKIFPRSAAPSSPCGLESRPSTWRNAPDYPSAARGSSSRGIASRTLAPFTLSTERSSKIELIPPGPAQKPGYRYRARRLQRELLAPRLRRESGGVTPTAQVTQATEGRRAEVQGCAAVVMWGGRPRAQIPAAGYAALGRGPRNPRSLITGSGAGLAISRERMQRKHRATRPVDRCGFRSTLVAAVGVSRRNVEQGGWTTAEQELAAQSFSSGDGLGIQQPGSNTRGSFFTATAPSGRARDRAMCPAVARNNEGRTD